jgi:hypothetical protein
MERVLVIHLGLCLVGVPQRPQLKCCIRLLLSTEDEKKIQISKMIFEGYQFHSPDVKKWGEGKVSQCREKMHRYSQAHKEFW